jgi:DNA-directed RNA polymerase specialized sigma24 family protein
LTIVKVYSSPADGNDRRSEFTKFYEAVYSTIVGELLALTGGLDHARAVGAGSFSRAWQAWPSIRLLTEPEMWVREDAMTRAYAPPRGMRLLQRGLPPIEPVDLDAEDDVLVTALQRLPMEQRLPLVLHYMAGVPVELIAEWARCTADQMEALLDDGFDALVAVLDWSVDTSEEDHVEGEEYNWTAEALQESGHRLPQHITTPPPTITFRHATAVKLTKRGAPVSAAAAACLGLLLTLSTTNQPAARPAAFSDDAPKVKQPLGPTLVVAPPPVVAPPSTSATDTRTAPTVAPTAPRKPRPRPATVAHVVAATSSVMQAAAAPAPVVAPSSSTPTATTLPPTPSTPPAPVTVTVTAAAAAQATSSSPATTTLPSSTEASETTTTETTWHRPSPRPRPVVTTTTAADDPPSSDETMTTPLPITTSASDDA